MKTTNLIIFRFFQIDWELIAIAKWRKSKNRMPMLCVCAHVFLFFISVFHLHDNQQTNVRQLLWDNHIE